MPKTFKTPLPATVHVTGPYQKHAQTLPVPQTVIQLLHEGIDANHPDFYALHVAMGCLSQHGIGLLSTKVRVEKGLTFKEEYFLILSDALLLSKCDLIMGGSSNIFLGTLFINNQLKFKIFNILKETYGC